MITVRNAKDEDLPAILEIYNDVILNTTAVYDYIPHSLERRREWFNDKKTEGYPVFVAQEDEVLLGFSSIGPFRKWEAYKFSVENSVYVSNEHRGKGVGKLLLQPLIDAARSLQLHTIVAGIDATNEASIALHKKFGFEEVAHFKEVGYKFGRWLDLKFLQLIL
jgi:phosphinothricin acetyltransferase